MPTASQTSGEAAGARAARWLVLFHQVPSRPPYLRVKVGRQLRQLGALALKNTVYVAPATARHRDGLGRIVREILESGGEAVACEARLVAGLGDREVEDRFREACDREFGTVAAGAARVASGLRGRSGTAARRRRAARDLERLQKKFAAAIARDWFGAAGRAPAAGALSGLEDLLAGVGDAGPPDRKRARPPRGATWVTRSGVMIDRIASAWLIRRFVDSDARFRFVAARTRPGRDEIGFDMAGAEFTHDDGLCTFEVLLRRFELRDSALQAIGEIVHDLDLGDDRHRRPETSGVGRTLVGMALATPGDPERLEQGATLLDGLYQSFRGRRKT